MLSNFQGQRKEGEEGQVSGNSTWVNQQPEPPLHRWGCIFAFMVAAISSELSCVSRPIKEEQKNLLEEKLFQSPKPEREYAHFSALDSVVWPLEAGPGQFEVPIPDSKTKARVGGSDVPTVHTVIVQVFRKATASSLEDRTATFEAAVTKYQSP